MKSKAERQKFYADLNSKPKKVKARTYTQQVAWASPYTQPPDGQPRVLISRTVTQTSGMPLHPDVQAVADSVGFGKGWGTWVGIDPATETRRELSPEAKGSVRRKKLARAAEEKAPLFAQELIQIEMKKNPGYYAGEEYKP
jgi:hypothetical protein